MAQKIDLHSLAQAWVHSHEEDAPGEMVFRPDSYPFPPSRGRRSFQLAPGGQYRSSGPGPDDRTMSSQGTWSLDNSDVLTLKPATGGTTQMKILSVSPDKLVVGIGR
jgi:hypothetical protein